MPNVPHITPPVDPDPRAAHLRRSWTACHNALFPDADFPIRKWELDVAGLLFERNYDVESIRRVLDFAAIIGSVDCCAEMQFSYADRDHVESLLPERPASEWDRPEFSGTWAIDGVKEVS